MLGVVIQIDAREAGTGVAVPLRAASHDHAAVCHLTDDIAWPVVAKLPKLGYDLFDGAFEGRIATPSASMSIGIEPWPTFAKLAIADTRFRLWTGEVGAPIAAWTQRVDARVTQQPAIADGRAELTFAVDDRWLDRALLATYAGTTGAEGPATLKGQAKPLALGAPRYVPGVLVDPVNSLFQVSGHGAIVAIDAALERLLRYGPPVQDYATVAELIAATIPAGRWATAVSGGWARFGAPPTGQVCFMVRGDVGGPNGWSRLPGQQIRRLALLSGGAGRIADASLNALDAAQPYNLSLYLDQQTTARELIQEVAASVNAVAGVSWMGRLFVQPVVIGAPALTLAADGSALPPVDKVKQLEISPPFGKLAITAERTWSVHQLADIAFTATLIDMGAWDAGTTYREGNIVQQQGSTWVYINPVASAGNAPPQLPTLSNAFWRVLAKAGEAGLDGSSAFTLIGNLNVEVRGNTVRKIAGGDEWNASAYSAEGLSNGAYIAVTAPASPAAIIIGLSVTPQASVSYEDPVASWYFRDDGTLDIVQSGVSLTNNQGFGIYFPGARYSIEIQNGAARYIGANGVLISAQPIDSNRTFYVDSSFRTPGGEIGGITFASLAKDGASAPLLRVQWSIDGVTNWHDNYFGADVYQRQSNDNGATWGPAYKVIGEAGDGPSNVFKRSATIPATPTDNSGNPPTGWTDGPPAGTDFLWQSKATFKGATQITPWSAPVRISGEDGFIADTETPNWTIPCYPNGTAKPSWTGGTGTISLRKGGSVITAGVTYSLGQQVNMAGLTLDGRTYTFGGIVAESGFFFINAIYNGITYTRRIDVKKTLDGSPAFRSTATLGASSTFNGQIDLGGGSTVIPANSTVTIAGGVSYPPPNSGNANANFRGRLHLYYRNVTDNGPLNYLGYADGSFSSRTNTGTPAEPILEETNGSANASFSFASASADKSYQFLARLEGNPSSPYTVDVTGSILAAVS